MKASIISFCFLVFQSVSFSQALLHFESPMLDNIVSFYVGNYDTALVRRNKVETCMPQNHTFYFDINGRLVKGVQWYDSDTQALTYRYDDRGDLIETDLTSTKYQKPVVTIMYKTYEAGRLIKDSSSSDFCKHLGYYQDGSLREALCFGAKHRLMSAFWFGIDTEGRMNRIIARAYFRPLDSAGELVSNRTLIYNEKGQMIREEELVPWKVSDEKSIFCPNAGSATFHYDSTGRIVEIERTTGPSQKIKYLQNG